LLCVIGVIALIGVTIAHCSDVRAPPPHLVDAGKVIHCHVTLKR
jgi:hypothetical protein